MGQVKMGQVKMANYTEILDAARKVIQIEADAVANSCRTVG